MTTFYILVSQHYMFLTVVIALYVIFDRKWAKQTNTS